MCGSRKGSRNVAANCRRRALSQPVQLAILKHQLGSLERVAEVITLNGYVNAATGFQEAPAVINGASDLLVDVFGEAGRHVRAAIGVNALPKNALVEVQMTVRVKP